MIDLFDGPILCFAGFHKQCLHAFDSLGSDFVNRGLFLERFHEFSGWKKLKQRNSNISNLWKSTKMSTWVVSVGYTPSLGRSATTDILKITVHCSKPQLQQELAKTLPGKTTSFTTMLFQFDLHPKRLICKQTFIQMLHV